MNIRHDSRSAQPVRFVLPARSRHARLTPAPATAVTGAPSPAELAWIVGERAAQLYPGVPRDAINRAAQQSVANVLRTQPSAGVNLAELALRETRQVISLYLALAQQQHLRPVA